MDGSDCVSSVARRRPLSAHGVSCTTAATSSVALRFSQLHLPFLELRVGALASARALRRRRPHHASRLRLRPVIPAKAQPEESIMIRLRMGVLSAIAAASLFAAGCATSPLQSAVGLYPSKPGPVNVKGSNKQVIESREYPYTFDDVFQAASDVIFRRGLIIEQKNKQAGTIVGNGHLEAVCGFGPCKMNITYILHVQEVNSKPTTRLTMTLDRHSLIAWGAESSEAIDILVDVQKHLASY